jgi:hypothetical protein
MLTSRSSLSDSKSRLSLSRSSESIVEYRLACQCHSQFQGLEEKYNVIVGFCPSYAWQFPELNAGQSTPMCCNFNLNIK